MENWTEEVSWQKGFNVKKSKDKSVSRGVDRRKQLLIKLTLAIISISICLAAAEFILREIIPIDDGTSHEFRIPHPVLGWVLTPDASYHNTLPERTVYVKYNSEGWRDVEHSVETHSRNLRVLVLGDSFMEAYSVNSEESFPRRLEELVQDLGHEIEVLNFGVGGYGTLQEYLAFKEMGEKYKPSIVLLGFYVANDIMNNSLELESLISNKISRPFLEPDRSAFGRISEFDYADAQRRFDTAKARQDTVAFKLTRHSVLWSKMYDEYRRIINKLSDTGKDKQEPVDSSRKELALLGVHYCEEPPEYTRSWDITKRILSRLRDDLEVIGGRLVIFTVPSHFEVSPQDMKKVTDNSENPDNLCIEEAAGYRRLGLILKELEIDFIDLLPEFRSVVREGATELYWRSDRHWNPEGHSLAARSVAKALLNRELLRMPVNHMTSKNKGN
jgi:hypothetical protein